MKFSKTAMMTTAMVMMSHPAFAAGGITAGKSTLEAVISWASTLGAAVVTLAIMYVGFKMVFQHLNGKMSHQFSGVAF